MLRTFRGQITVEVKFQLSSPIGVKLSREIWDDEAAAT